MIGAPHRELGGERKSSRYPGNAAVDIMFVLGTLFTVKSILLQFDSLWTYAGPVSLLASVATASWRLWSSGESWADLGLRRPSSLSRMLLWTIIALVLTMAAGVIIEFAISSANIGAGVDIDPRYSRRFADLPGNTPLFLYWLLMSWVIGGFVEEMLFRALLLSRLERLFSRFPYPAFIAIGLQSFVFGQQHYYYQGLSGALATGGIALVSGALYLFLKRSLWPLIISHGLANTIGMTLIYAGVQQGG